MKVSQAEFFFRTGTTSQRSSISKENPAQRYLLTPLSKSKVVAVEIVPVLSMVKPQLSGEMKYCSLNRKEKTKHCRDTTDSLARFLGL